jgi:flavin prenyltransferase
VKLARIGVAIAPAIPAFYIRLQNILELVDHQVGKIIDRLGFPNRLSKRWGEDPALEG